MKKLQQKITAFASDPFLSQIKAQNQFEAASASHRFQKDKVALRNLYKYISAERKVEDQDLLTNHNKSIDHNTSSIFGFKGNHQISHI